MLLHKNGRYYIENISYSLPDDVYIDFDTELTVRDGFVLCDKNRSFELWIEVYEKEGGAKVELEEIVEINKTPGCDFREWRTDIVPVSCGGVNGYYIDYDTTDGGESCRRYAFDIKGKEHSILLIWLNVFRSKNTFENVINSKIMNDLLDSIRAE